MLNDLSIPAIDSSRLNGLNGESIACCLPHLVFLLFCGARACGVDSENLQTTF